MEVTTLKSASRPFKAIIQDVGELNFRYRPAALTMETLPDFIALEDEPTVKKQRRLLTSLETLQTTQKADQQKMEVGAVASAQEQPEQPQEGIIEGEQPIVFAPQVFTEASIQEMAVVRRSEALAAERDELERAAAKLCLLLDPEPGKGHDLTQNGVPLPVTAEVLARYLPQSIIEAVTESILTAMQDPFGLGSSNRALSGMPSEVPVSGDA